LLPSDVKNVPPSCPSSKADYYLGYLSDGWGTGTYFELCYILSGFECMRAFKNIKGALPLSKAGERSTSFGMIPLFSRLNMPSEISSSVIGGGSAKGSFLKFLGRILLG